MPDIQSELSKLANAWDTHEQAIRGPQTPSPFTKTGNASKDVFTYIRDNSRKVSSTQVLHKMVAEGYKQNSTSSLITQMKRSGLVQVTDEGALFTTQDEYRPLVNPHAKKAKLKAAPASAENAGIAALTAVPEVKPVWDAETALANLSVKDAHALWVELNKMFGGAR